MRRSKNGSGFAVLVIFQCHQRWQQWQKTEWRWDGGL